MDSKLPYHIKALKVSYERSYIMMARSARISAKLDLVIAQIAKIALNVS